MTTVKFHNLETGEVIERDMNSEELAQLENDKAQEKLRLEKREAKATEKAALLERLGLTAEEVKLLLS